MQHDLQARPSQANQVLHLDAVRRAVLLVPPVLQIHPHIGRLVGPVHAQLRGQARPVDGGELPPRHGALEHGGRAGGVAVHAPRAQAVGEEGLAHGLLEGPGGVVACAGVDGVGVGDARVEMGWWRWWWWGGGRGQGGRSSCGWRIGECGSGEQNIEEEEGN